MKPLTTTFSLLVMLASVLLSAEAFAMRITVKVEQTESKSPRANVPVTLQAVRAKGPFETQDPKPAREWRGTTNAEGIAVFPNISEQVQQQGLRLQAVALDNKLKFKSPPSTPTDGLTINVPIYARGGDMSKVKFSNIRMIIEPWEKHLVFSQIISLSVTGPKALDTEMVPNKDVAKDGIPIELPLKASGIQPRSKSGQVKTINSTIYYKGVIKPGEPVVIEALYSLPVKDEVFTYSQDLAYPIDAFELIIPLETRFKNKLPRLTGVGLSLPGAKPEDLHAGFNAPGLRPDKEFVTGKRQNITPTEGLKFRLHNLPYHRPVGPWIALVLGLLGAIGIFAFAAADKKASHTTKEELTKILIEERTILLRTIQTLDERFQQGAITEQDYESESLALKGRLALVIQKIESLSAPKEPQTA